MVALRNEKVLAGLLPLWVGFKYNNGLSSALMGMSHTDGCG